MMYVADAATLMRAAARNIEYMRGIMSRVTIEQRAIEIRRLRRTLPKMKGNVEGVAAVVRQILALESKQSAAIRRQEAAARRKAERDAVLAA
jgi:hypothetical protein